MGPIRETTTIRETIRIRREVITSVDNKEAVDDEVMGSKRRGYD